MSLDCAQTLIIGEERRESCTQAWALWVSMKTLLNASLVISHRVHLGEVPTVQPEGTGILLPEKFSQQPDG